VPEPGREVAGLSCTFLPFAFCLLPFAFSPPVGWPVPHIFVTISGQIGILYSEQEINSAKRVPGGRRDGQSGRLRHRPTASPVERRNCIAARVRTRAPRAV